MVFSLHKKIEMLGEAEKRNLAKQQRESSITARIKLGMPSRDCAYSGICRIEPEENQNDKDEKCFGIAKIKSGGKNKMLFEFQKETMSSCTIEKYFGSGYFVIIEAYRIPEFIEVAFNRNNLIINKGIYQVFENDESLLVELDLRSA